MKQLPYMLLAIASILFFSCTDQLESDKQEKLPKDQRIALLAEMEIEMTQNPITKEVPKEKLYEVRQQIIKEGRVAARRAGEEWTARGPINVGGRSRAILADARDATGNTVFTGSVSGGLWKVVIDDQGPSWERIEGYLGNPSISTIVQDPTDPETMYLGTGEGWFNGDAYRGDGIYKSVDGGLTWERLPATANGAFNYVQKLLFTADGNILAATRAGGVRMSTDGGASWFGVLTNENQGFSNRAADLEITVDGTLFASMGIFTQDGVYRSSDGGFEWEFLPFEIEPYQRVEIATSEKDPNVVLALTQDEETRQCSHIFRSLDRGDTWEDLTMAVTDFGENFARNQAWYDLIAAIDPNDSDVLYVGGVNLYKSMDGGQTWTQVSEWFSGTQRQTVHADQHNIVFVNGTSSIMYFSNDGGLYKTSNGSAPVPDILDQSFGYISTQFYACDIHPDLGRDFFVAGAQDNGTNRLQSPGTGLADEVLGGDGAVCHISQLDGNVQIGSFQRGGFVATFSGSLETGSFYGHEGDSYFINPTDLDDEHFVVYASQNPGHYYRTDLTTNRSDSVEMAVVSGERASAFTVNPHNSDILYVGTNFGSIVEVTDPRGDAPTSRLMFSGPGFTRNIDIDQLDPDRMLVTYSNFGIDNVFLSEDGGSSWRSIESDLPDMPVRWGIFSPSDPGLVLLGTELGVWAARVDEDDINWENIAPEIGLTRVNQLRYRSSDLELLAATYGRGLYTTSRFAKAGLRFNTGVASIIPDGILSDEYCNPVEVITYDISTPISFDEDVAYEISVSDESTAVEGVDFILLTTEDTLKVGEEDATFELLIFDDATVGDDKTIELVLTSDAEVLSGEMIITILEDDKAFDPAAPEINVEVGAGGTFDETVFNGFWEGARTQVLYRSEYLTSFGVKAGQIEEIAFDVVDKDSELPYENFTVSMALVPDDDLPAGAFIEDANMTVVFSGVVEVVLGRNTLVLDVPFVYDGQSNLFLEICFDNSDYSGDDLVAASNVNYRGTLNLHNDGEAGCPVNGEVIGTSKVPNIAFKMDGINTLFGGLLTQFHTTLNDEQEAFFARNDSLFHAAAHLGGDEVCMVSQLISNSGSIVISGTAGWIDRIHEIQADGDADLEITLLMPLDEEGEWLNDMTDGLFATELVGDGGLPDWTSLELISIETTPLYHAFTLPYVGAGYYTVGDLDFFISTDEITEQDIVYDKIVLYNLSGQLLSNDRYTREELPTGIYIRTYLHQGRVMKTEKVFID